jgi:SAM-dependent methyltransferase
MVQQEPKSPSPPFCRAYSQVNKRGWARLVRDGCDSSQTYGPFDFEHARAMLDPRQRLPWHEIRSVLCLAASGGQQAPLFASLGYEVVSADICVEQLRKDQQVALQYGFAIECVEADMLDLSMMYGARFDLVYQAVSACYVPDVRQSYREVAKVLRPGGYYRVEHWNPLHLQLQPNDPWNGSAYEISRPQDRGVPIPWHGTSSSEPICLHFIHSLGDLLGGLCEAGFGITSFEDSRFGADPNANPGSHEHLASFIPPFFTIHARAPLVSTSAT